MGAKLSMPSHLGAYLLDLCHCSEGVALHRSSLMLSPDAVAVATPLTLCSLYVRYQAQ